MEEKSFLLEHGSSLIAVGGTIFGAVFTQFITFLNKRKEFEERSRESALERDRDFQKHNIIDPLLEFIDQDLKMAQQVYSNGLHNKEDSTDCKHQADIVVLTAKIKVLDSDLYEKFEEYGQERISLNTKALSHEDGVKDINAAYGHLKKIKSLASEIMLGLSMHYSKQEPNK